MKIAPIPVNEELRLKDLYTCQILDSEDENEFADLLQLAAQICKCPNVNITFVDKDRIWRKAGIGIDPGVSSVPRDLGFCSHAILEKELLVVEDTLLDERFADNPQVTSGIKIRFYAGAPIVSPGGYKLGALCLIDQVPRQIDVQQARALRIISQQVAKLLELRINTRMLKKKAEEELQLEKELLLRTLNEHEKEIFFISSELHEDIAQALAATKFYLELAEEANEGKNDLIKKSRSNVLDLLQKVRTLSNSITPTTLKQLDLQDSIQSLVSNFYRRSAVETKLSYNGDTCLDPVIILPVYRIVEEHFDYISKHQGLTSISVKLDLGQKLVLIIESDGSGSSEALLNKEEFSKTRSRISALSGTADLTLHKTRGCQLVVSLPLPYRLVLS